MRPLLPIEIESHTIELPRRIMIGYDTLKELGRFILELIDARRVTIITGNNIIKRLGSKCEDALDSEDLVYKWLIASDTSNTTVQYLTSRIDTTDLIIGFGGGKSVDVAKYIAYNLNKPFISVPTSASHDGIASPFASIRGSNKPYSITTRMPIGVLADIKIIRSSPKRLLASGCGDLLAKITAIKDWELGRDEKNEYFGTYSASLAHLSASIIMREAKRFNDKEFIRTLVEALISSGVAAGIAGSSRPCSGSEHLFSHALEFIAPNKGFHGERCGLGTIMMANLHGLDWEAIRDTLDSVDAPTNAYQIGLSKDEIVKALILARKIRPERYTILNKIKLNEEKALELAKRCNII